MHSLKRLLWLSVMLLVVAMPVYSFAEDLAVNYAILSSESVGTTMDGTIRVEVTNPTGNDIQNVDLRLENAGPNSIERDLFQFGSIAAGKSGIVTGLLHYMEGTENTIEWKIDYDDADGNHKQVIVLGIFEDLLKGSE